MLQASMLEIALLSVLQGAVTVVLQSWAGRLIDRIGRKPFMVMDRVGFVFVPLFYAFAPNVYYLFVLNGVLGVLVAFESAAMLAYQLDVMPELLRGLAVSEFTEIVNAIPLVKGATQAVKQLKDKNYKVGIISDSYTLATEIVAHKLEMDFHVANRLEVKKGIFTGILKMPLGCEKTGCPCQQSVCKRYHLARLAKRYSVDRSNTVAVGDSCADLCMIERWLVPKLS